MNYPLRFLFISILSVFVTISSGYAQKNDVELDAILNSAESFFKFIKQKDYPKTWNTLTRKSQETIVDDVFKEIIKKQSSQKDIKSQLYLLWSLLISSTIFPAEYFLYFSPLNT